MADQLAQNDQDYCAELVRSQDYDRWLTVLLAAPEQRRGLTALYAFNHELAKTRESVSEAMVGEIRLQWWREVIDSLSHGPVRTHPVAQELAWLVKSQSMDLALMHRLVDGRGWDLYDESPADFDQLMGYAQATGATLMRLAVQACGVATEGPIGQAADHAGTGWVLTGLLRAIGFHARMQRNFMPIDALKAQGLDPETLFKGEIPPEINGVVQSMAERAGRSFDHVQVYWPEVPKAARPPLYVVSLGRDYLRRLKKADHDPFAADFARGGVARLGRLYWASLRGRP